VCDQEAAVNLEDVYYRYGGATEQSLRGLTLTLPPGTVTLVCGPSGGGKSTFCRCLNGLVPHFYGGALTGRISVLGMSTLDVAPHVVASRVGMVFQNPEDQLVTLDVSSELSFGPQNLGLSRQEILERVNEAATLCGIDHLLDRSVFDLSMGQQQRVALASALAMRPELLVLDEPMSQIDDAGAVELLSVLMRLKQQHQMTIVLTEHRIDLTIPLADTIVVVCDGRVARAGTPQQMVTSLRPDVDGVEGPPVSQLSRILAEDGLWSSQHWLTVDDAVMGVQSLSRPWGR